MANDQSMVTNQVQHSIKLLALYRGHLLETLPQEHPILPTNAKALSALRKCPNPALNNSNK
jgi:hypothetical protein